MKALIRLVTPHGEPPHFLVVPQPETEAERKERDKLPVTIRFEAIDNNLASLLRDLTDHVAEFVWGRK